MPKQQRKLSKKQQAKVQSDMYRLFIQRKHKENKRYHLGRYTSPRQRITRPEQLPKAAE